MFPETEPHLRPRLTSRVTLKQFHFTEMAVKSTVKSQLVPICPTQICSARARETSIPIGTTDL